MTCRDAFKQIILYHLQTILSYVPQIFSKQTVPSLLCVCILCCFSVADYVFAFGYLAAGFSVRPCAVHILPVNPISWLHCLSFL